MKRPVARVDEDELLSSNSTKKISNRTKSKKPKEKKTEPQNFSLYQDQIDTINDISVQLTIKHNRSVSKSEALRYMIDNFNIEDIEE